MTLTIITINKNNAGGLRKTMRSVFQQSFADIEYIIVDGLSSDTSVDVIKELINSCPFDNTWISEADTGVYNAMNKGIRMAHGDYLLFLNSGDTFVDGDCVKRVFDYKPAAEIINARCNVVDGDTIVWISPFLPNITLKTLYTVGLPHQSTFIKRDLFKRYGLYDESFRYNADIAFWYKSIIFGDATSIAIDTVITNYDNHGISSVESNSERYAEEMRTILREGILPHVIPDYEEDKKYRDTMREFEWLVSFPVIRSFLRGLRRILK
jgi:glycosyltransferase involved in cell wall biosynthesis